MDYKYIEQLLERYWQCETSVEEERILRAFFQQKEIPAHLLRYRDVFAYQQQAKEVKLSDDFDARLLAKIEEAEPVVKARRLSLSYRLRPLLKAAACVAIALTVGNAVQHAFNQPSAESDYNYDAYKDSFTDPQTAYGEISDALSAVSESINKYQEQPADSSLVEVSTNTEAQPEKPDTMTIE